MYTQHLKVMQKIKGQRKYYLVSQVESYLKNKNSSNNPKNLGANTQAEIIKKFPNYFELTHSVKKKDLISSFVFLAWTLYIMF